MMELAPIVLFVYNRPKHTNLTIESLKKNHLSKKSRLIIYSDGPKNNNDIDDVKATRNYLKNITGFKEVTIFESAENKGLANSIIEGVTNTLEKFDKAIILEDDLLTSPFFLTFMNEGLDLYKNSGNIYTISGYAFPININITKSVLLPFVSTWGWGTWKEKWSAFERNPQLNEIIAQNPFLKQRFNMADYDYTSMLTNARNSWGIHWYFSVFLRNGLGVFPTKTLIYNIGYDGSGVNCKNVKQMNVKLTSEKITICKEKKIDLLVYHKILCLFTQNKNQKNIKTILNKCLKKLLKK